MKKIKRILWVLYMLVLCKPYSLRQFKIYSLHLQGMSKEEWDVEEKEIKSNPVLVKFFKLKNTTQAPTIAL